MEKSKVRFTSLDTHIIVKELQNQITGCHLQNIYDVNPRTFLLKFTKKDTKVLLLIESGIRIHATKYDRENPNVLPSSFAAKLRKHLRERRLTKFEQVGFDRVVHFEFGHDTKPELTFHLFLELYATGNIILTDHNFKVVSLIRDVIIKTSEGVETKTLSVGMVYDFKSNIQSLPSLNEQELRDNLLKSDGKESARNALKSSLPLFANSMIDEILKYNEINPKEKLVNLKDSIPNLIRAVDLIIKRLDQGNSWKGCIFGDESHMVDFYPILLCNFRGNENVKENDNFNVTVDEYFYKLEETKSEERKKQQEVTIKKKFDAIKREQEHRIKALQNTIESCLLKAHVIESNLKSTEDACLVIRTGLENDLSWSDLESLIEFERQKDRPVALLIQKLRLNEFLIELKLPFDEEEVIVEVDIRLNGHGNAERYYSLKKSANDKLIRTQAAFEQAMKSAEAKVRADNKIQKRKNQHLIPKRKPFWFEKFNWFISSDSYLILSGKDMHQNEYIVKRIMKDGDVYVHADLTGASSVIVKNHRKPIDGSSKYPPIPHRTLVEAGAFSLCFSRAWEAKIVTSAWWVNSTQVSKTAPSGEYLSTGSFMIRGKKNFLPPSQLTLGFGFMFVLNEEGTNNRRSLRIQKEQLRDQSTEDSHDINLIEQTLDLIESTKPEEDLIITAVQNIEELKLAEDKKKQMQKKETKSKFSKTEKHDQVPSEEVRSKNQKVPRGKHGKMKKIKGKYKDQDEEERQARMELLASKPKKSTLKPSSTKQMPLQKENSIKSTAKQVPLHELEVEGEEEDIPGLGELAIIDSLTGTPTDTDVLCGIVTVAAPFIATQHYKYRVKLLPGNLKRGTAAKTALSLIFSENKSTMSSLERDLLRSIGDAELNSTMPGKVRISGSGVELTKVKKSLRKR